MNTSAAALLALRAFRKSTSPMKSNSNSWSVRTFASKPTSSGGGSKSKSSAGSPPEPKVAEPPANVFKKVDSSTLGPPGTSKQGGYKNPEYFSYHKMSYCEMELVMAQYRVPQPSAKTK